MKFDRYVYPGTNVLKNLRCITNSWDLEKAERVFSGKRMAELYEKGITGRFDTAHMQSIHRYLFGEIYGWAGEFRDIQIYKGGTEFAEPDCIREELEFLCGSIREKNYFRGLPKHDAAVGMADAMARLNAIHPFREGNGRTQRLFVEQLAANAGYDLDFTKMSENDMRDASRMSARCDNRLMRYLFEKNMTETGVRGPVSKPEPKTSVIAKALSLFHPDKPIQGKDDMEY